MFNLLNPVAKQCDLAKKKLENFAKTDEHGNEIGEAKIIKDKLDTKLQIKTANEDNLVAYAQAQVKAVVAEAKVSETEAKVTEAEAKILEAQKDLQISQRFSSGLLAKSALEACKPIKESNWHRRFIAGVLARDCAQVVNDKKKAQTKVDAIVINKFKSGHN